MLQTQTAQPEYILGHSNAELERLIEQGRYFGDLTLDVLKLAGVAPGMRVLDLGCGPGDVTFLAAGIVGPEGAVIGVDASPEATALGRKRAADAGLTNVTFETADIRTFVADEPVDAIIGRLILMYFPEPAEVLRHLLRSLKPGGIIAFQEIDIASGDIVPNCPITRKAADQIEETFLRAGIDTRFGVGLRRHFLAAGLPEPGMNYASRIEGGPNAHAYAYLQDIARTIFPLMVQTGVTTAEEFDLETLADRVREEVVSNNAVVVMPPLVGAWSRKPQA